MKFLKFIFNTIQLIIFLFIVIFAWHKIENYFTEKTLYMPGEKIKIYDNEYIHSVKMGSGDYTIVFLPGLGTASPYYDFYKLATEVSKNNQVIIMEPFGYGFSDNTLKKRSLDNYEYELSKVLEHYNVDNNIILLGHSYSGLSNLNYSIKHDEVKGLVCLDCTTAYQIETHVKDGKFTEEVPKTSKYYYLLSPSGLTRFIGTFIESKTIDELLIDVPVEFQKNYRYFFYNKTMNKTIINETNDIMYNQLDLFEKKYRDDLHVLTILSDETIESMKKDKEDGYFNHDWEEMHNLLISNPEIQKIYVLSGNHYIHHGSAEEISYKINNMIDEVKND